MARIECDYTKGDATKHYKADITPLPYDTAETLEIKLMEELIDVISEKNGRIVAGTVEFKP